MHDSPDQCHEGMLYVVATPIGNLQDITFRAIDTLTNVAIIAAEDTRHTRKILSHYKIKSNLVSCHEHNEAYQIPMLLEKLKSGLSVALVSDAGTPSISDPGYRLISAALAAGIRIVPIPGPSAVIAALTASGLPSNSFFFIGFLPAQKSKRRLKLEEISKLPCTLIFYESPKRIKTVLEDMLQVFGDRLAVIAREMTKIHEEFLKDNLSNLINEMKRMQPVRGEITLVVSPCLESDNSINFEGLDKHIMSELKGGAISSSSLAKELSKFFGIPKNVVYQKILEIKSKMDNGE